MSGVRFSGLTNSTFFTECCGVAINCDQRCCPRCGEEVPGTYRERWNSAMRKWFGPKRVAEMRDEAARKYP